MGDSHNRTFINYLKSVTRALPDPATPITLEDYITEVNCLIESKSSGPSIVTPAMVKTEALDQEPREISWRRFNFPWCTRYSPNRYQRGLDLLIHKDPEDFRPHRIRPIIMFYIEANLHNKHLGKLSMRRAEEIIALAPEQYGRRKGKAAGTQALNNRLFYNILRIKRVPVNSTFADLVSNYYLVVHSTALLSAQISNTPK